MSALRQRELVRALSRFFADVLALRPIAGVQYPFQFVWDQAPLRTPDASFPFCLSCRRRVSNRRFCKSCTAKATIKLGPPLVETLFWSSSPDCTLSTDHRNALALLESQRTLSNEAVHLATELHESARLVMACGHFRIDANVYTTRDFVYSHGSYATRRLCGIAHQSVIGGLGHDLYDAVRPLAKEWLAQLDAVLCAHFGIPARERSSVSQISFTTALEILSHSIAKRVCHLEIADSDPLSRLCSRGVGHLIKMELVRCELYHEAQLQSDVVGLNALRGVAMGEEGACMPLPETMDALLRTLQTPAPELLRQLPEVAQTFRFDVLRAALASSERGAACRVARWREDISRGALCLLIQNAIAEAQKWTRPMLQCLQFPLQASASASGCAPRARGPREPRSCLPMPTWVDVPSVASVAIVPSATLARRRSGLDATGMRVALLAQAILQLDAHTWDGPHIFRPGVLRASLVARVTAASATAWQASATSLKSEQVPLSQGLEWHEVRQLLEGWEGSHFECDVRGAVGRLAKFSVAEIAATMTSDMLRKGPIAAAFHSQVNRYAIHRPNQMHNARSGAFRAAPEMYEEWLGTVLSLAIGMVTTCRASHVVTLLGPLAGAPPPKNSSQMNKACAEDVECDETATGQTCRLDQGTCTPSRTPSRPWGSRARPRVSHPLTPPCSSSN